MLLAARRPESPPPPGRAPAAIGVGAGSPAEAPRPPFRPWRLIGALLAVMLAVSALSRWYARDVTLPRYCEDPERALDDLGRVLTEDRPAREGPTRPYVTAARLLFLVPRGGDEPEDRYLARLRAHLDQVCR